LPAAGTNPHDLPVFDFNLLVKKTPQWLMSTDEHYQQILSSLPAPILLNASSACIPRIPSPNTQRKKESYISNILSDFTAQCSSLVSISDDNFKSWASKSSETAGKNKYQVFAYHMQCLYGDIIGSAFRELPHETKEPPDITTLTKYFKENSWVNEPLQTLMERIENAFKSATLMSSIKKIPAHRRPVFHTQSRRKTANSLVNHIQCRISYLSILEPVRLHEHALSIYPEFNVFQSQCDEVIEIIIKHEYGNDVIDAVSTTSVERQQATKDKRSAKVKSECRAQKREEMIQSKEKLSNIKSVWPSMVSQEQIFECLNAYRDGTIWKTPAVCAVCFQYSEKTETLTIDEDTDCPKNLEGLRIEDEFIIRKCIIA
jgi:hypothetical protein